MSTWLIILLAFLSLLLLLLIAMLIVPFRLIVDSRKNRLAFEWQPFGKAALKIYSDDLALKFQILLWKKELSLLSLNTGRKKPEKPSGKAKGKERNIKFLRKKLFPIWKTFKVKKFDLLLDTDDYCRNAYLYPVFFWFSNGRNRRLQINYQGDNELLLIVENRMIRILRTIIF